MTDAAPSAKFATRIQTTIEPLIAGYHVWAEVVGGRWDGHWLRQHFPVYSPEMEMCSKVASELTIRMKRAAGVELVWDSEVRWAERR